MHRDARSDRLHALAWLSGGLAVPMALAAFGALFSAGTGFVWWHKWLVIAACLPAAVLAFVLDRIRAHRQQLGDLDVASARRLTVLMVLAAILFVYHCGVIVLFFAESG